MRPRQPRHACRLAIRPGTQTGPQIVATLTRLPANTKTVRSSACRTHLETPATSGVAYSGHVEAPALLGTTGGTNRMPTATTARDARTGARARHCQCRRGTITHCCATTSDRRESRVHQIYEKVGGGARGGLPDERLHVGLHPHWSAYEVAACGTAEASANLTSTADSEGVDDSRNPRSAGVWRLW